MDIRKLLQEYIDDSAGVGAAIGYIDNGVVQYYAYGKKDIDSPGFIDKETIFEIGSISKVFTVIALMEMVKQGKIKLDDPIEKYLSGVRVPQKDGHKITIWNLATHTSGLPSMPDNFKPQDYSNPYIDYSSKELYEFLNGYTLTKRPGEYAEYSNLGMGLLGHILTLIENQSYDNLIKDKITVPLGMKNTAQNLTATMQTQLAHGHAMMQKVSNWNLDVLAGAGALRSNIQDMTYFLEANIGIIDTSLSESIMASHKEQCSIMYKQAFAWIITQKNDTTIIWHNGATGGYRSFIGFDLKNKKGVVILTNSTDDFPDRLGFYILDPVNFKPEKQGGNQAFTNVDYLKKFTGTFETEPVRFNGIDFPKREFQNVLVKNKLYYARGIQLLPESENVFQLKGLPDTYKISFILDKEQNVIEFNLIQPNGIFKAYPKK